MPDVERLDRAARHSFLQRQQWHGFTAADLHRCQLEAEVREAGRRNPKRMTENPHLKGVLGELVYSWIVDQPLKWGRLEGGDGGEDFPGGINVRARQLRGNFPPRLYVSEGDLEAHPNTRAYVLVAIDFDNMEAAALGWATRAQVEAAPVDKSLAFPAHSIKARDLRPLPVELDDARVA